MRLGTLFLWIVWLRDALYIDTFFFAIAYDGDVKPDKSILGVGEKMQARTWKRGAALPFWKFEPLAWHSGKVQILNPEEKGIFIDLCCRIWLEKGSIRNDDFLHRLLRVDKGTLSQALQAFFNLGILSEFDGLLRVKFLDDQLRERELYLQQQAEFGASGGRPKKGAKPIKKEESRKKKEEYRENPPPTPPEIPSCLNLLAADLRPEFERWLEIWAHNHNSGIPMHPWQLETQLKRLLGLPEELRQTALTRACEGGWKNIQDIRGGAPGATSAAPNREPEAQYEEKDYN